MTRRDWRVLFVGCRSDDLSVEVVQKGGQVLELTRSRCREEQLLMLEDDCRGAGPFSFPELVRKWADGWDDGIDRDLADHWKVDALVALWR